MDYNTYIMDTLFYVKTEKVENKFFNSLPSI